MAEPVISAASLDQSTLESWGARIGEAVVSGSLPVPLVIALRGPLGAGKSVLARAIARGAGVESHMPSPTYNLLFAYHGRGGLMIQHVDLYRLTDQDDVWELGWRDLAEGEQLVLVEWPERAEGLLWPDRWDIRLEPVPGDPSLRTVRAESRGGAPPVPPVPPMPPMPPAGEEVA